MTEGDPRRAGALGHIAPADIDGARVAATSRRSSSYQRSTNSKRLMGAQEPLHPRDDDVVVDVVVEVEDVAPSVGGARFGRETSDGCPRSSPRAALVAYLDPLGADAVDVLSALDRDVRGLEPEEASALNAASDDEARPAQRLGS
jgi:hypothetical protein